MAPNKRDLLGSGDSEEYNKTFTRGNENSVQNEVNRDSVKGNDGKLLRSSFPGIWKPSGERGSIINGLNPTDWIRSKGRDDDIGNYWRVHDKVYDLEDFIPKHPGGSSWLEITRGTDITEAFEASHIINIDKVEVILAKYFISEANHPRNSPYTFKEDGFYKTLKRKVAPILKEVGTDSTQKVKFTQDILALGSLFFSFLGVWFNSILLQIVGGLLLGMTTVAAHNFFHMKDTWRKFYFDLSFFSSYEWRISHALSHHLYPNTIMDYEIAILEPFIEFLPNRPKTWITRYCSIVYAHGVYMASSLNSLFKRIESIAQGKQSMRAENFIILLELLLCTYLTSSFWSAFCAWTIIHITCSYYVTVIGFNAAHHHPECFHDGDEPRIEPDFGLCQLDATAEKADDCFQHFFVMLVTFGEHPLHHLFPTVCHSKLHYLKPVVEETLREYLENSPMRKTQLELFIGTHKQCARTSPNPNPSKQLNRTSNSFRLVPRGER